MLDKGVTDYAGFAERAGDILADVRNRLGEDKIGEFKAGVFDGAVYIIYENAVYRYAPDNEARDKVYTVCFERDTPILDDDVTVGDHNLRLKIYRITEENTELINLLVQRLVVGNLENIEPSKAPDRRLFRFPRYINDAIRKALVSAAELPDWVLDRDHRQINAEVRVYDRHGHEVVPVRRAIGGDLVLLDNENGRFKVDEFKHQAIMEVAA